MIFQSYLFLFAFFPVLFIVYYVLLKNEKIKLANIFLAMMSFVFYAYGNVKYLYFLSLEVLVNYAVYRLLVWLEYQKGYQKVRKWLCGGAVAGNLFLLFYYKYYNFFIENWNGIFHTEHSFRTLIVPLGISFITFQQIAFLVDVYRGECDRCTLLEYTIFVSFFPHISSGPIMTQDQFFPILRSGKRKEIDWDRINRGIFLFVFGLGKKVLLADMFGQAVDWGYGNIASLNGMSMFLIYRFLSFQIYFDFSGYSDMALGLGMMFGFHFHENFDYPYISASIREFWRRWHMSLSGWFKEYLYIPLGGNRRGKFRTVVNKMIVFVCTGIWHGASFNFLFWGIYHGFFLMLEEYIPFIGKKGGKLKSFFQHVYALLVVCVGFVFFRADTMKQGCFWIREMFTDFGWKASAMSLTLQQLTPVYLVTLAAALVAAVPVNSMLKKYKWYEGFTYVLSLAGFALCVLSLAGGTYNPFIYFRF